MRAKDRDLAPNILILVQSRYFYRRPVFTNMAPITRGMQASTSDVKLEDEANKDEDVHRPPEEQLDDKEVNNGIAAVEVVYVVQFLN